MIFDINGKNLALAKFHQQNQVLLKSKFQWLIATHRAIKIIKFRIF